MPLEDPNIIDMSIADDEGNPILAITDSGSTCDAQQRLRLLNEKLSTYARYLGGEEFRRDNPGIDPGRAKVQVFCAMPPTADMLQINQLEIPGDKMAAVPVSFSQFDGLR